MKHFYQSMVSYELYRCTAFCQLWSSWALYLRARNHSLNTYRQVHYLWFARSGFPASYYLRVTWPSVLCSLSNSYLRSHRSLTGTHFGHPSRLPLPKNLNCYYFSSFSQTNLLLSYSPFHSSRLTIISSFSSSRLVPYLVVAN